MKHILKSTFIGAWLVMSQWLTQANSIPEPLMLAIQEYQGKSLEACMGASDISNETLEEMTCRLEVISEIIISLRKIKIDCKNLLNINTKVPMSDCELDMLLKLVNEGGFEIIIDSLPSFWWEQPGFSQYSL